MLITCLNTKEMDTLNKFLGLKIKSRLSFFFFITFQFVYLVSINFSRDPCLLPKGLRCLIKKKIDDANGLPELNNI